MLAVLLLAACRQPVPGDYADYIGHWRGDGVRLVITADGRGDFERVRGQQRQTVVGPVRGFDATGFEIGHPGLATRFAVTRPPELRDGRWRMVIDDFELSRVEILPTPGR
ncbi:hypothetical protein P873_06645 [Arenimonas composti TR7-09 = DSM 18010]|uniref:Uncharacterized protein n=2 Tax=Arenimonas TaxID=490567 RepID=A0A091BFM4_9GAMM|nr:hypothetical protein P873_06645 [Arenimonas composti TR7-09 = DSM 18010]